MSNEVVFTLHTPFRDSPRHLQRHRKSKCLTTLARKRLSLFFIKSRKRKDARTCCPYVGWHPILGQKHSEQAARVPTHLEIIATMWSEDPNW